MAADDFSITADISSTVSGTGAPIVLVHGTSADRYTFRHVEPILARHFTVHCVDRRGRRHSGDPGPYHIDREFADLASIVNSLPEPAILFGHSFGATVSLGAARLTPLRGLVLYEPSPGVQVVDRDLLATLDRLAAEDSRDELLSTFMQAVAGLSPAELEQFKSAGFWKARVKASLTIPREIRAEEEYAPHPTDFATMSTPTLLLTGSESPEWARKGTEVVRALLPNSRVVRLEGHGHLATMTAPELLASEIERFARGA